MLLETIPQMLVVLRGTRSLNLICQPTVLAIKNGQHDKGHGDAKRHREQ